MGGGLPRLSNSIQRPSHSPCDLQLAATVAVAPEPSPELRQPTGPSRQIHCQKFDWWRPLSESRLVLSVPPPIWNRLRNRSTFPAKHSQFPALQLKSVPYQLPQSTEFPQRWEACPLPQASLTVGMNFHSLATGDGLPLQGAAAWLVTADIPNNLEASGCTSTGPGNEFFGQLHAACQM